MQGDRQSGSKTVSKATGSSSSNLYYENLLQTIKTDDSDWFILGLLYRATDNATLGLSGTAVPEPLIQRNSYLKGKLFGDLVGLGSGLGITGGGAIETIGLGASTPFTEGASLLATPATTAQTMYGVGIAWTSAVNLVDDLWQMFSMGDKGTSPPSSSGGNIASKTANNYKVLECDKYAKDVISKLKKAGKHGKLLTLKVKGSFQMVMSYTHGADEAIGETGFHQGVLYEGKVYDPIHKDGVSIDEWKGDFYSADGDLDLVAPESF